ncbi:ABC transporter substrate-binding protein [Aquicoccus sp. SCR17]|nr:ABC transporter substrate-binding protein [Carideicomes alvinocaridis]
MADPAGRDLPRLAAIDWAMLETALALGLAPVAACELVRYREDAVRPPVPEGVVDLGLRGSPNFELLQLVQPGLILSSPWYAQIEPRLSAIAPVMSLAIYGTGESPWDRAVTALHALARRVGRPGTAEAVEAEAAARLWVLRNRLSAFSDRPLYLVEIGDARHFRAFGPDSMFGDVLARLGLENAWDRPTEYSFAAPLPLERLAERPEARIIALSGIPPVARAGLARSVLWHHLPAVAGGRLHLLDKVNPYGGLPSGLRFADLLGQVLTEWGTG